MRAIAVRIVSMTSVLCALGAAIGCSDPCRRLAKEVCLCERSELDQQACSRRVDEEARTREPSEDEEDECARLLDGCTCAKLATGDLAACGLARP